MSDSTTPKLQMRSAILSCLLAEEVATHSPTTCFHPAAIAGGAKGDEGRWLASASSTRLT